MSVELDLSTRNGSGRWAQRVSPMPPDRGWCRRWTMAIARSPCRRTGGWGWWGLCSDFQIVPKSVPSPYLLFWRYARLKPRPWVGLHGTRWPGLGKLLGRCDRALSPGPRGGEMVAGECGNDPRQFIPVTEPSVCLASGNSNFLPRAGRLRTSLLWFISE